MFSLPKKCERGDAEIIALLLIFSTIQHAMDLARFKGCNSQFLKLKWSIF